MRTDYDAIGEAMMTFAPAGKTTFRVTVNRADKSLEKNSAQIGADLGGYVLERRPEYKVDLSHSTSRSIFAKTAFRMSSRR